MSMSFIYYNFVDDATLTASTENALFPVENIQDPRSTKVFRSTASSASVVIDLTTPTEVDTFACVPHFSNGFGFSGSLTLEANPSDSWGSPAFSVTITDGTDIDRTFQVAYKEFAASQTYRYWRISATGSTYVELSRIYLGMRNTIGGRSISYNWRYRLSDNSKVVKNLYGQRFADEVNRQREFDFAFKNLNKTQVDEWFKIYDYNGLTKPFFMRIGCDGIINDLDRFSGEVYFDQIPQITNSFYALYDVSVSVSEAL